MLDSGERIVFDEAVRTILSQFKVIVDFIEWIKQPGVKIAILLNAKPENKMQGQQLVPVVNPRELLEQAIDDLVIKTSSIKSYPTLHEVIRSAILLDMVVKAVKHLPASYLCKRVPSDSLLSACLTARTVLAEAECRVVNEAALKDASEATFSF